jgi:imidazolonepropionase-like amidohydrolase
MSLEVNLDNAVEVIPAVAAVTVNSIKILGISENYGSIENNYFPGMLGPNGSVTASILLDEERHLTRQITVWQGDEYQAVKGTWTDETLKVKIAQVLATT